MTADFEKSNHNDALEHVDVKADVNADQFNDLAAVLATSDIPRWSATTLNLYRKRQSSGARADHAQSVSSLLVAVPSPTVTMVRS